MDVSVVMGVYNGGESLRATLDSIQSQSLRDLEIIVVDDGSDDATKCLLKSIVDEDSRIRVLVNDKNIGLTKSLIRGCDAAVGTYIARIDNGDIMVPKNRLETQLDFLNSNPDTVVVGGRIEIWDYQNLSRYRSPIRETDQQIRSLLMRGRCPFGHITVMFRSSAYRKCGGYAKFFRFGQDSELWSRLLAEGQGYCFPKVFAIAPMKSSSISVGSNNKQLLYACMRKFMFLLRGTMPISQAWQVPGTLLKILVPVKYRMNARYKGFEYLGPLDEGYDTNN